MLSINKHNILCKNHILVSMTKQNSTYKYKRYKKPRKWKKTIIILSIIVLFLSAIFLVQSNVSKILVKISKASVQSATHNAVNQAVYDVFSQQNVNYTDLVTIKRDSKDNILSIEANTTKVNLIARETTARTVNQLNIFCNDGVKIPLFAFTGIEFLSGFGPKITFKIIPVSSADCNFKSNFISRGINQTLHEIYITVTAYASVIMPTYTLNVLASTDVLVASSLIVGTIPNIVLGGNIFP